VFTGQILRPKRGVQGKSLRERSDTVVKYARQRLIHDDQVAGAAGELDDLININREMEGCRALLPAST